MLRRAGGRVVVHACIRSERFAGGILLLLLAAAGGCGDDKGETAGPTKPHGAAGKDSGSSSRSTKDGSANAASAVQDDSADAGEPGLSVEADRVVLQTPVLALDPGADRMVCFAVDVTEDMDIASYSSNEPALLHHVLLSRALTREPDGLADCNALYRTRWQALFMASKGHTQFALPDGFAHELKAGDQLVAQVELRNSGDSARAGAVKLELTRTRASGLRSVGTYVLGTAGFRLSAGQTGTAEVTCQVPIAVELVAMLPAMHQRGSAIALTTGTSASALSPAFSSNPFRFDEQHVAPLSLKLDVRELAHTRCDYDNPDPNDVAYSEGPDGESCFLLGFAADRDGVSNCLTDGAIPSPGTPAALDGGASCDAAPTDAGIGKHCTRGGGQCPRGMRCTADFGSEPGICSRLGCASDDECGAGATCCKLLVGGVNICLQNECLPPTCLNALP